MFLSLEDVFIALNATVVSRNIKEGEQLLNSNHVISCAATSKDKHAVCVYALCLQTSALNSEPHEIKRKIQWSSPGNKISGFICSCKAGNSGQCKHIAAVLLYATRNDVRCLEIVSQTDKACKWNTIKGPCLEQYKPQPITETHCFSKKVPTVKFTGKLSSEYIQDALLKVASTSALAKHRYGRRKSPVHSKEAIASTSKKPRTAEAPSVLDYIFKNEHNLMRGLMQHHINIPDCCIKTYNSKFNENPEYICKVTANDKGKWKEQRQFRITGSRCYAIYTYAKEEWKRKALQYFWPKQIQTNAMLHGRVYEINALCKYRGVCEEEVVEMGLVVSTLNPWLGYSPDGVVLKQGKPFKLLEIKCPVIGVQESATSDTFASKCKFLSRIGENLVLKKRHMYYGQIQVGMAISIKGK